MGLEVCTSRTFRISSAWPEELLARSSKLPSSVSPVKENLFLYRLRCAPMAPGGWGFRTLGSRHIKVARLSVLRTGRIYPPGKIPGTPFCQVLSRPHGHRAAGRIKSMKNLKHLIGIKPATVRLVILSVPDWSNIITCSIITS